MELICKNFNKPPSNWPVPDHLSKMKLDGVAEVISSNHKTNKSEWVTGSGASQRLLVSKQLQTKAY